MSIFRW